MFVKTWRLSVSLDFVQAKVEYIFYFIIIYIYVFTQKIILKIYSSVHIVPDSH